MGNIIMKDQTKEYIERFEGIGLSNYELGKIAVYMLFKDTCPVCEKQFNLMQTEMGFTLDSRTKENEAISKMLPVEINTKFGAQLLAEAKAWSKSNKNPDLEIKYTPIFLDEKTHKIIATGLQEKDFIMNMLQDDVIKRTREGFLDEMKAKGKKDCDAVACGLKERVDQKKSSESIALRKENRANKAIVSGK